MAKDSVQALLVVQAKTVAVCAAALVWADGVFAAATETGVPTGLSGSSPSADYPCWRGATGSGGIEGSGLDLIDNAKDARLLWISEERSIGWGWGPTDGAHNQGNSNVRSSGYGGMVVADGRGYFITYEPSGTVVDDEMVTKSKDRRESSWKINADDVLFCLDMKTGRTLWKAVFPEKGLNLNWYREGTFTYPCVADGKVFFTGTAGRMYALDAVTGKPLWESSTGQGAGKAETWRRDCLHARKCLRRVSLPFDTSPAYADGVIVCADCEGTYAKDLGWTTRDHTLTAMDARTGKLLWNIPKAVGVVASPVRWTNKGREYIIAMSSERTLLVEPKSGRILWELKRRSDFGTPAVWEDYLAMQGTGVEGNPPKPTGKETSSVVLRITPERYEIVWEEALCRSSKSSPLIHRGFAYVNDKTVELATGKMIPGGISVLTCGTATAIDGLLIGNTSLYVGENGRLKPAGSVVRPGESSGNITYTSSTVAQGCLIYRGTDLTAKDRLEKGCYYCFDLRKPIKSAVASPPPPPSPTAAELAQDLPALLKTLHALNQSDREVAATAAAMVPPASKEPLLRGLLSILDEGAGNWQAQVMAGRLLRESGASLQPHAPALLTRMKSAFDQHDLAMFDLIGGILIGLRTPAEQYPSAVITHMRTALEKAKPKLFDELGSALSGDSKAMALALGGMLPDLSESAQIGTIETLGGMGRNAASTGDAMIQLLNVPSNDRTLAIVRALPRVLGGKAAQPLIDLYSRSLTPQVHERPFELLIEILQGIGSVATEVDQQTIGPALLNICSDRNLFRGGVDQAAIKTYVAVMGTKALPTLVEWLKKDHLSTPVLAAIASFGPAADGVTADLTAALDALPANKSVERQRIQAVLSQIHKKNSPPRLAPVPPVTCAARGSVEIPFTISDDDDAKEVLKLVVVKAAGLGEIKFKSATVLTYQAYNQSSGADQFEVAAEDAQSRSAAVTVSVTVEKAK